MRAFLKGIQVRSGRLVGRSQPGIGCAPMGHEANRLGGDCRSVVETPATRHASRIQRRPGSGVVSREEYMLGGPVR